MPNDQRLQRPCDRCNVKRCLQSDKLGLGQGMEILLSRMEHGALLIPLRRCGSDLDYAQAKRGIASMGTEQSVHAFGSPGYVLVRTLAKGLVRIAAVLIWPMSGRSLIGSHHTPKR